MKYQTTVLIVLLLLLLVKDSHQLIRDISFLLFCKNIGPGAVMVQGDVQTMGDRCTVVYPFPAKDDEEATEYCNLWYMYPLVEGKQVNGQVQCTYENVYECKTDYTLINGHCYRMVSQELVTYSKAKELCQEEKIPSIQNSNKKLPTEIINLYDKDLIRLFKAYFTNMKIFFIQNTAETLDQIDFKGGSGQYAVAFGMASVYKTGPGAIIELPKNKRAQAMCAYRAEDTPLSLAYKVQKLAPYYYPFSVNGMMIVWRTVGHYNPKVENDITVSSQQCEASMRAVLGPGKGDAFDATKVNVNMLTADFKKSIVKSVAPYSLCCKHNNIEWYSGSCSASDTILHYAVFRTHYTQNLRCQQHPTLNSQTYPTTFQKVDVELPITFLFYPQNIGSDNIVQSNKVAIRAPVLCNLHFTEKRKPINCEDGWKRYDRDNGLNVCHKVFFESYSYYAGMQHCKSHEGALSTFTTVEEFALLRNLIDAHGIAIAWLGIIKKSTCPKVTSVGSCSSENIFDFTRPLFGEDNYAVRKVMGSLWDSGEPNNYDNSEWCIQKHAHGTGLNDYSCHGKFAIACVKLASMA